MELVQIQKTWRFTYRGKDYVAIETWQANPDCEDVIIYDDKGEEVNDDKALRAFKKRREHN